MPIVCELTPGAHNHPRFITPRHNGFFSNKPSLRFLKDDLPAIRAGAAWATAWRDGDFFFD